MNVASLQNSKKLYELSRTKWMGEASDCVSSSCDHHGFYNNDNFICPKYTAGYLLRKLKKAGYCEVDTHNCASYYPNPGDPWEIFADTPEDCLALLAIKLIEEKILTPDSSEREEL